MVRHFHARAGVASRAMAFAVSSATFAVVASPRVAVAPRARAAAVASSSSSSSSSRRRRRRASFSNDIRRSAAVASAGGDDAPGEVVDLDDLDFDLDDLMPDTIMGDLEDLQEELGAEFDDDGVPLNYGDAALEARAMRERCGVVDRTGAWKLLRLGGPNAIDALIASGAAAKDVDALKTLAPGQGAAVSFDRGDGSRAMCHVQDGGVLIIAPTSVATTLLAAAGPDAATDLAEQCVLLSILGPKASDMLSDVGIVGVLGMPPGTHAVFGAFYTLVPIRPRRRGERRFLRTFPGDSLRPPLAFNPRPRRLSTPLLTPLNSTPISSLVWNDP